MSTTFDLNIDGMQFVLHFENRYRLEKAVKKLLKLADLVTCDKKTQRKLNGDVTYGKSNRQNPKTARARKR